MHGKAGKSLKSGIVYIESQDVLNELHGYKHACMTLLDLIFVKIDKLFFINLFSLYIFYMHS